MLSSCDVILVALASNSLLAPIIWLVIVGAIVGACVWHSASKVDGTFQSPRRVEPEEVEEPAPAGVEPTRKTA